jgi:hypothetical protein
MADSMGFRTWRIVMKPVTTCQSLLDEMHISKVHEILVRHELPFAELRELYANAQHSLDWTVPSTTLGLLTGLCHCGEAVTVRSM